ncbi:tyrosine-type recombinase/integrase [Bifidobacterium platyrrhinorum]|uniref:Tyrosine-type recombinase/integrase n=1 Tax=Bifidobacterium platyrrhinorum TaxID=2661628 RepID=A0A6L9SS37_9BIFI|nr:tyrosine-type recombinase/integrase [Bifidobacterium platyrrhinorum]NEG55397.1 tyrosine-type recombinase/integrase [Bifidobacterium platyrrhinorum]
MPRENRTGVIRPIKEIQTKTLSGGTVKTYVRYRAKVDGKWVTASSYRACESKITAALREKREWGMGLDRSTTLGEYMDQWLDLKQRDIKPNSYDSYKSIVNVHLAKYRKVKLADVTPSAAKRMLRNMRNLDGTEPSANRKLNAYNVLRQIFDSAVADRLIPTSPISSDLRPRTEAKLADVKTLPIHRKAPKPLPSEADSDKTDHRSGEQHRKAFTADEVRAMLRLSAEDVFTGTRFWWKLLTGMRQSEILGVTLDDLDLYRDRSLEHIDGPEVWTGTYTMNWKLEKLNKRHGCGEPNRQGVYPCGYKRPSSCPDAIWVVPDGYDMIPLRNSFALTPPKSQRGSIKPIIPQLGAAVHRYLEATKDIPNPYNLLFRTREGYPIDMRKDALAFRDLVRRAGIPDPDSRYGHECRRSVATFLFDEGVDPGIIKRLVGHSSIEMSDYYRDVPTSTLLESMERVGDKLDLKQIEWKDTDES